MKGKMMKNIRATILILGAMFLLAMEARATMYSGRPYDSNLQRWIQRDPIGERGGINLYTFVGNNPVNFVDPWGLTTYVWPPEDTPSGAYGPTATVINDGSDNVLPAVPFLTDSQGMQGAGLDFQPVFLPELPVLGKAAD